MKASTVSAKSSARNGVDTLQHSRARKTDQQLAIKTHLRQMMPIYGKNAHIGAYGLAIVALIYGGFLWQPVAGLYMLTAGIVSLLAAAVRHKHMRSLMLVINIIPLSLLATLGIQQSSAFVYTVTFYICMGLLTGAYLWLLSGWKVIRKQLINIRARLLLLPLALIAGQLLGVISFGLTLPDNADYYRSILPWLCIGAPLFALIEELLFRGLLQEQAARLMHPAVAAGVSALLFAVVTMGAQPWGFASALISGATLSFMFLKTHNIILNTVLNATSKLFYLGLIAVFVLR